MVASSSFSSNNGTSSDPPLCSKGCGFYVNPTTANMCSKCYKDFLNLTQERLKLKPLKLKPSATAAALGSDLDHDHAASTTSTSKKKTKNNRCDCCNKCVGLTGFECRCGGLFCGFHRYPEEHACSFDFKTFGRLQLEKQNPLCAGEKLRERA